MMYGLDAGRRVVFNEYLMEDMGGDRAPRERPSWQNTSSFKVSMKALSIISTCIFAVVTLGTFTLIGSILQYRRIRRMEPPQKKCRQHLWAKPLIEQTNGDPDNIEGEYLKTEWARGPDGRMIIDRRRPVKIAKTPAAAVFLDKKTMPDLLEAVFEWAFDDLSKKAKYPAVLNASAAILKRDPKQRTKMLYESNMDALYHWMILFMIKHGGIETSCDRSSRSLVLNENLKIAPSEPCYVRAENSQETLTLYLNEDDWTPRKKSGVVDGVDPVSLKWIERRLASQPKLYSHFEILLLEGLIPDDNPRLRQAKEFLRRNNSSTELVRRGIALVRNMTKIMKVNFAQVLTSCWRTKANSSDVNLQPIAPKEIHYPNFTARFVWTKKTGEMEKALLVARQILAFIGYALANVLTFGMLSFAVTVYQHEKLNKLVSARHRNRTHRPEQNQDIWLKPPYEKQNSDPENIPLDVEKLSGIIAPKETGQIKNIETLISSSFDYVFRDLLSMSKSKVWNVHFNRSSKIFNDTIQIAGTHRLKYQDNINSVYNLMVFNLIEAGGLKQIQKECRVYFNNQLHVGYSKPCRVPAKEEGAQVTFFLNKDPWTPSPKDNPEGLNGIDPVGVKWLIERLKDDERMLDYLKILLLNGLIPDDAESLVEAKYAIADQAEKGNLVKQAYEQISTIALVLAKKYSRVLLDRWDELADDDECDPPLEKESVFMLDPNGVEQEWMPPAYLSNELLLEEVIKTKSLISPIWKNIDHLKINPENVDEEQRVLPSNRHQAFDLIQSQYFWIHAGIRTHGCLMSALTTHIYQGSDAGNHNFNPSAIKAAMAEYLVQKPDDFKAEIEQSTSSEYQPGWNVDEYRNWLLTGRSPWNKKARENQFMGDLEMELFSRTFHIQLTVFEMGKPYLIEEGRMVPTRTYGPNTTEKFVLLNDPGFTFYALMPKCRGVETGDDEEVREALRHNSEFWGINNGTEYGRQIRAVPRARPLGRG